MSAATDPIRVFLRVGDDNEQFEIGSFTPRVVHVSPGTPVMEVIDNDRPLAGLLRRAADAIEADDDLPV